MALLPTLADPPDREALRFPEGTLRYAQLALAAGAVAARLEPGSRIALWAGPTLHTAVAAVGALAAGAAAVPLSPKLGRHELEHVLRDSAPAAVLAPAAEPLPEPLAALPRIEVDPGARAATDAPEPDPETPALIVYTSGTTGPPKGVVLPRGAIAANLDALYEAWDWTTGDVLVHGLPLFHVHGLVLGTLGPLRVGGAVRHLGRFSPAAAAAELDAGATMMFGVPTMYHRLAQAAEESPAVAAACRRARLLVSGSAPLPTREAARIEAATGQRIVERYGMTETIMICGIRADGDRRPGYVGPPLAGVDVRLVDDDGIPLDTHDDETIGEIEVRSPALFTGYLNRPDATADAFRDGWFRTGDMAARAPDGSIRIVGRRSTDLIKTGGYRVGAGEVEWALLDHPDVLEAAVTGEPDDDLGERIVAWVVARPGTTPDAAALADHVARLLQPHKRPRAVHLLPELPRNELGKVTKKALAAPTTGEERRA